MKVCVIRRSDNCGPTKIIGRFVLSDLRITAACNARGRKLQYLLSQHQSEGVKGKINGVK